MSFQFDLPTEFTSELRKLLKQLYHETIKTARRDIGLTREFVTLTEGAKLIGISRNTLVNNFVAKGLPTYTIEGKRWIKQSELYEFIEDHRN